MTSAAAHRVTCPQKREFSEEHKRKLAESNRRRKGEKRRPFTDEHRKHISESHKGKMKGETNPNWKRDNVGYCALHRWVDTNLKKTETCQVCKQKKSRIESHNISGEYRRDPEDWIFVCHVCHHKLDGRMSTPEMRERARIRELSKNHDRDSKGRFV